MPHFFTTKAKINVLKKKKIQTEYSRPKGPVDWIKNVDFSDWGNRVNPPQYI